MAKNYDRACLLNLAIKRTSDNSADLLTGSSIHFDEGIKSVESWEYSHVENRMYIQFVGDEHLTHLSLDRHYIVDVPNATHDEKKAKKKKGANPKKKRN